MTQGGLVHVFPSMPNETNRLSEPGWRASLPELCGRLVTLREPVSQDVGALVELLSCADATRFGMGDVTPLAVRETLDRAARDREAGLSFTYALALASSHTLVGLLQVRELNPGFEAAEWECTIAPASRGSGIFLEAARLAGSFAFGPVGAHRLEARVLLQDGRANGAMRKLGAVQEGVLRRSARRGGTYYDQVLWSILKEDWGEHWVSTAPRVH